MITVLKYFTIKHDCKVFYDYLQSIMEENLKKKTENKPTKYTF